MYRDIQPVRLNRTRPVVTYALIAFLAVIFAVDQVSRFIISANYNYPINMINGILTAYGAKNNALIISGQFWRIFTANLLHADLWHLLANGFGMYIWGTYIELFYGRAKYAAILLLSGIACIASSFAFSPNPSLGASGMVFGLLGALLGIRKFNKHLFNAVFGVQVLVYIGISIVWGFLGSRVDNFGHIGGLVGGFLASRVVGLKAERLSASNRALFGAGYALFSALCFWIGYYGIRIFN